MKSAAELNVYWPNSTLRALIRGQSELQLDIKGAFNRVSHQASGHDPEDILREKGSLPTT
jgi:hypothetical protein